MALRHGILPAWNGLVRKAVDPARKHVDNHLVYDDFLLVRLLPQGFWPLICCGRKQGFASGFL